MVEKKQGMSTNTHNNNNMLEVRNLKQYFPIKAGLMQRVVGHVKAVDGISFSIQRGQTMGLVGESGCGKTTVGKSILRLVEKTSGDVIFDGIDIYAMTHSQLRTLRPKMQIIFQDPFSSLSPRLPVSEIIGEAVKEHNIVPANQYDDYLDSIMKSCGLQPYHKARYPHEFSGGQRQRICIARALALNPSFVVCDEPVSALDVSVQAQIINLLKDLQGEFQLAYLFISHDLSVVEHISDYVGVMYLGDLVEYGSKISIFKNPLHPYTQALLSAAPVPDPAAKRNRIILEGSIPSPANPPSGCKFHTRCRHVMEICKHEFPKTREMEPGHTVNCHLYNYIGILHMAKQEKKYDDDDCRVIASMDVEGLRRNEAPFPRPQKQSRSNPYRGETMTPSESRRYTWYAVLAGLSVVLGISVTWVLFILFCIYVWFR
jgi:peptide/nickel transport system ATP-binding protein